MGRIQLKTLLLFVLHSSFITSFNDGFVILLPTTTTTIKTTTTTTKRTLTVKELTTRHRNVMFTYSRRRQYVLLSLSLSKTTNTNLDSWELLENDFSSSYLWDQYYHNNPIESSTLEWHKSISFDTIGHYCLSSLLVTDDDNDDKKNNNNNNNNQDDNDNSIYDHQCSSFLPEHVIDLSYTSISNMILHLTLLDSSISCMETVRRRYENYPQYSNHLSYVVGNVLELETIFSSSSSTTTDTTNKNNDVNSTSTNTSNNNNAKKEFDVILDKGLMDALFCNDNWETTVTTLLQQSYLIMKKHNNNIIISTAYDTSSSVSSTAPPPTRSSRYVLIGYKLSTTTQETLIRIGQSIGLQWEFNCIGSNDRVWISVAHIIT